MHLRGGEHAVDATIDANHTIKKGKQCTCAFQASVLVRLHEAIRLVIFSPGARVPSKNEKNICFLTGRVLKHDTR